MVWASGEKARRGHDIGMQEADSGGKRRVGRPVKTWEEEVKNTIEEWGPKKETAKDRALWRHGTCGKPSNPRKRGKLT